MGIKRMRLKKRKSKFRRIRVLIYVVIVCISFSYSFYYISRDYNKISNEEFINLLVSTGNANILNEYKSISVVNKVVNFLFDINLNKPVTVLNNSILKFGAFDPVVKEISLEYSDDDYSDMDDLKSVSEYIEDPNPTNIDSPVIYLYNSHQLENYSSEGLSVYGVTPNVLMASYLLREKLNKLNIPTIVEETNMSDILDQNNWDYSYSYQASRSVMQERILKYPTLTYFIDIHRDSIGKSYSTVTIGDKSYAKVLFVIGKDHDNWEMNNRLAIDFSNLLESKYKGISRGIIEKSGLNVNGVYNQDLSSNCLLIELGGVDNTIEEVNNTVMAIADVLTSYIIG